MKIGIVSPYNIYAAGGVQEAILAYAKEYKKRGMDVSIISPQPKDGTRDLGVRVYHLGRSKKWNTPFHTTVDIGAVAKQKDVDMLLSENFDVLHFHEPWIPFMPPQVLKKSNAVNIGTLHAKPPDTILSKSAEVAAAPYVKSVLKRLDYICAVSEPAASYCKTLTSKKIEIVPNGVDLEVYNPQKTKTDSSKKELKTIFYVGRLEKRKGVICLLQAYRQLADERDDVELIVAGDGPKRKVLENYAKRYRLKNVTFLGRISDQEKIERLKASDIACFPALFGESFGIVILEAMAMGAVVVAGDNPGYRSVLKDTGHISLVNPEDPELFVKKLNTLLDDHGLRRVWQDWAKQYIKQFDYVGLADHYEAIYRRELEKKND